MTMKIIRVDDGQRVKIVCKDCHGETYRPILGDLDTVVTDLANAGNNHRCRPLL